MALGPNTTEQGTPSAPDSCGNVVITGVGVVSPIGIGHEAYWESLCQQRSGVGVLPDQGRHLICRHVWAARSKDLTRSNTSSRGKHLKVMCREIQTGFAAAGLAVEQAQLDRDQLAPERMGVVFGSEMLYCDPDELEDVYDSCIVDGEFRLSRWGEAAMAKMYPLWMLMYLPNMIACHVGIAHDARGPNNTICQGEVSSLLAMIEAATIILRGHADVMIAGGSSSRIEHRVDDVSRYGTLCRRASMLPPKPAARLTRLATDRSMAKGPPRLCLRTKSMPKRGVPMYLARFEGGAFLWISRREHDAQSSHYSLD